MTEQSTTSIPLQDLTIDQLVQISQGIGHQIDKLREQRAYLKKKINARLEAGERNQPQDGDAAAPGAAIEASANG